MRMRVGWPELLGVALAALLIGGMGWHNGRVAAAQRAARAEKDPAAVAAGEGAGWEDIYTSGSVSITLAPDGRLVAGACVRFYHDDF